MKNKQTLFRVVLLGAITLAGSLLHKLTQFTATKLKESGESK